MSEISSTFQNDGISDVRKAFQGWKSSRISLTSIVTSYEESCNKLCGVISSWEHYPTARSTIEQALDGIDLELKSLRSEERHLRRARGKFLRMRNQSYTLAPISRLPAEILDSIFTLCSRRCERPSQSLATVPTSSEVSPAVLASVCSFWRRIALASPSLWSHIDIVVCPDWSLRHPDQIKLWAQRSQQATLKIHVSERIRDATIIIPSRPADARAMVDAAGPLMPRADEFRIATNSQLMLDMGISCWEGFGGPGVLKTLDVSNLGNTSNQLVVRSVVDGSDNLRQFKRPFPRFKLATMGCTIAPSVTLDKSLVDLRICYQHGRSRVLQLSSLVEMLAAIPSLQILVLSNTRIDAEPTLQDVPPITLNHLKSLVMRYSGISSNYHLLLSHLLIGSNDLDMSVTVSHSEVDIYHNFFCRTKLLRLHVVAAGSSVAPIAVFCPIPHVQALALHGFDIGSSNLITGGLNPWPLLHTLYLLNSNTTLGFLHTLGKFRSIRKLFISNFISSDPDEPRELVRPLVPWVDDLEVIVGSSDSALKDWSFTNW